MKTLPSAPLIRGAANADGEEAVSVFLRLSASVSLSLDSSLIRRSRAGGTSLFIKTITFSFTFPYIPVLFKSQIFLLK